MQTLSPCPYCSAAIYTQYIGAGYWEFICNICEYSLRKFVKGYQEAANEGRIVAEFWWNKRATPKNNPVNNTNQGKSK